MSKFDLNSFIATPEAVKNAVQLISIDKLVPYKNHCFKLYDGERLDDLVRSIINNGVIVPIIVRPISDSQRYEILVGHNRVYAAGKAGKVNVPAIVKENLTEEEVSAYVVESKLIQRGIKDLKISEQAYAISERYKYLKNSVAVRAIEQELSMLEGIKSPVETQEKSDKLKDTAEEYGLSRASIARLLRINTLSDRLKDIVDEGNIKIRPAVELSYISAEMQEMLSKTMAEKEVSVIDMKMAKQLREISQSYASPSEDLIAEVLNGSYGDKAEPEEIGEKVTIPKATYSRYLGGYSKKKANLIIEKALALYFEKQEETA